MGGEEVVVEVKWKQEQIQDGVFKQTEKKSRILTELETKTK